MLPRPKPGESEEDLLKFQKEFLAGQGPSSASVVKKADKRKSDGKQSQIDTNRDVVHMDVLPSDPPCVDPVPPMKKSRFRSQQEEKMKLRDVKNDGMNIDPEAEMDMNDRSTAAVLSKIIERDTRNLQIRLPRETTQAFPSVFHRGRIGQDKEAQESSAKKKSVFAQQFSQMGARDFGVMLRQEEATKDETTMHMDVMEQCDTESKLSSQIITGSGLSATFARQEVEKIHHENLKRLSSMPESEIMEEQRKLMETLDPKLLSFLTSKKEMDLTEKTKEAQAEIPTETKNNPSTGSLDIAMDESDLPFKPQKEWVNMDKLECDKLFWLKELPPPKTSILKTGQQARFDFNGLLVPADADLPPTMGLHHHGEEPERAGYTLEELFQIARSTNVQQRVIALNTMAKIFRKVRNGDLDEYVQCGILPAVIDGGVVFLLRWALDDSIDMVMVAAVSALHNLVVNSADQISLEKAFSWYQGHVIPSHNAVQEVTSQPTDDNDEAVQETDADVLKKDVILCLVERMNILPRLYYILDKWHPQAPTVLQILGILTRIVMHSTQLAYQVSQCHKLLQLIFKEFLPTTWTAIDNSQPMSDVYGVPVVAAMKLVKFFVSSGRHLAANLMSAHGLQKRLLRYLMDADAEHLQLPATESYCLQTETMRVLKVCLLYGHAVDTFLELFPVFVQRLQQLQQDTADITSCRHRCHIEMIGVLEAAVHVAATSSNQKPGFSKSQDGSNVEGSEVTTKTAINWSHVADLLNPVVTVTVKMMADVQDNYQFKKHDLQLLTACLNFTTTFYNRWHSQPNHDTVACLQSMEDYCNTTLLPCWDKFGFQLILRNLSVSSNLLAVAPESHNKERIPNLPDLGCICEEKENQLPVLTTQSPFGFLVAILRQINVFCNVHKGLRPKILPVVMNQEDIVNYLRKTTLQKSNHLHSNHFTKVENLFHYFYLKLACLMEIGQHNNVAMLQHLTLTLLTRLHHGDEFLVHDIMSTVLFNPLFWNTTGDEATCGALADLKLADTTHLRSTTSEQLHLTQEQLLLGAKSRLPAIRGAYLKSFSSSQKAAFRSRDRYLMNPLDAATFVTSHIGECLLPKDWMYMPLIDLYNIFCNVGADVQNALSISEVDTVSSVLQWVYLLEKYQKATMSTVSITLKVSRVLCAFLTGNDLFLDQTVHCYLAALLREFTQPLYLDQMNFDEHIPGLVSFYDLYVALLQQYDAVSFGDSLFGCYVLLPLQQKHHIQLRRALWTEYKSIIRTLYLPVTELLVPVDRYLDPEESDLELLGLYLRNLMSLSLRPKWAPILYLVAVHHVNRFCYTQDGQHTSLKHRMLQSILNSHQQEVRKHLLYYKMADVSKPLGMEFYETLPPQRQKLLEDFGLSHSEHLVT